MKCLIVFEHADVVNIKLLDERGRSNRDVLHSSQNLHNFSPSLSLSRHERRDARDNIATLKMRGTKIQFCQYLVAWISKREMSEQKEQKTNKIMGLNRRPSAHHRRRLPLGQDR